MTKQMPLLDLVAQYQSIQPEIDAAIKAVLQSGHFILGTEVSAFEEEVASYLGVDSGIGVASGTDALILALRALEIGPGDEVILPAYTFFATISTVLHVGATPVLVDINPDTYCLDMNQVRGSITSKTRAVIPVHLYGHPAEMEILRELSTQHGFVIIEDNAQAFGAEYKGRKTGSFGDICCLSFFPSKNLGGYGDGGMVVTNHKDLARTIKMLRTHGWKDKYFPEMLGYNSRLDSLQAAILRIKLRHIDAWNDRRRELANIYTQRFSQIRGISHPLEIPGYKHVYHLYIIRTALRDSLQTFLNQQGIATGIYYPLPVHLTQACTHLGYQVGNFPIAERAANETLAIPIYPEMNLDQVNAVITAIENSLS